MADGADVMPHHQIVMAHHEVVMPDGVGVMPHRDVVMSHHVGVMAHHEVRKLDSQITKRHRAQSFRGHVKPIPDRSIAIVRPSLC